MCFNAKANAWGEVGHAIVCEIAWLNISDKTKQWVRPLYQEKGYNTFAEACSWADHIRGDQQYDYLAPQHYVNLPKSAYKYDPNAIICGRESCVVRAIQENVNKLTKNKTDAEALLLLGHFVGDIHQPMHVSHAEDWGGNKLQTFVPGEQKQRNLHWFWDIFMVKAVGFEDWKASADLINGGKACDLENIKTNPGSVHQWAEESYELALRLYADYPEFNIRRSVELFGGQVCERLGWAGYRLAWLLNQRVENK